MTAFGETQPRYRLIGNDRIGEERTLVFWIGFGRF